VKAGIVAAQDASEGGILIFIALEHSTDVAGYSRSQDLIAERTLRDERKPVRQWLSALPPFQRDLECVLVQPDDLSCGGKRIGDQYIAPKADLEILGRKPKRVHD
jgi:hypothetical protein